MILSKLNQVSQRFEADVAVALATAMPAISRSSSSTKRKRSETPTPRRRNPDTNDGVPDADTENTISNNDPPSVDDDHKDDDGDKAVSSDILEINSDHAQAIDNNNAIEITPLNVNSEKIPSMNFEDGNDQSKEAVPPLTRPAHLSISVIGESDVDPSARLPHDNASGIKRKHENMTGEEGESVNGGVYNRQARMLALLQHRKLLLQRVRQCRRAASTRNDLLIRDNPELRTLSAAAEIENHRELTKIATSMSKKQLGVLTEPMHDMQQEPRGEGDPNSKQKLSISLRRGASVGRRMNAALSALAPGGLASSSTASNIALSAASTTSGAAQISTKDAKPQHPDYSSLHRPHAVPANVISRSGEDLVGLQTSTHSNGIPIAGFSSIPSLSSSGRQLVAQQTASAVVPPASMSHPFVGKQPAPSAPERNSIPAHKSLKVANNVARGLSTSQNHSLSSNAMQGQSKLNLPTGHVAKGKKMKDSTQQISSKNSNKSLSKPHNMQQQTYRQQQRKTIFPEAIALRERRNSLRRELSSIFLAREKRSNSCNALSNPVLQPSSPIAAPSHGTKRLVRRRHKQDRYMHVRGPDETPQLPRKRKTHWDIVLEEMRWMATDFIEERKWKCSAANLIANDAVRATRELLTEKAVEAIKLQNNATNTNALASSLLKKDCASMKIDFTDVGDHDVNSVDCRSTLRKMFRWSFSEITQEQEIFAEGVANTISGLIMNLNASNSMNTRSSSLLQVLPPLLSKELLNDFQVGSTDSPVSPKKANSGFTNMDASEAAQNGVVSIVKEDMYKEASRHVDEIMSKLGLNSMESSLDDQRKVSEPNDVYGLALSEFQVEELEGIENKWENVKAGAILHGPAASGKTIIGSCLLWRHRKSGPQLVICSSLSMVSLTLTRIATDTR